MERHPGSTRCVDGRPGPERSCDDEFGSQPFAITVGSSPTLVRSKPSTREYSFKLKFSPDKVDTMVVQAIALLDDLDKEINIYAMRVKVRFPSTL